MSHIFGLKMILFCLFILTSCDDSEYKIEQIQNVVNDSQKLEFKLNVDSDDLENAFISIPSALAPSVGSCSISNDLKEITYTRPDSTINNEQTCTFVGDSCNATYKIDLSVDPPVWTNLGVGCL